jgi:radical SAM superfamily enzyme YgiQ (UPF0313 family)
MRPLKVLFVNCPKRVFFFRSPVSRWFPLGLAYVASAARNAGYHVKVLDTIPFPNDTKILDFEAAQDIGQYSRPGVSATYHIGLGWDRIQKEIEDFSPDVVGISCLMTAHRNEVIRTAGLVKRFSSKIKVVVGGTDAAREPGKILETGVADYVVRGDGEKTIVRLFDHISQNESVKDVNGLAYMENGTCVINKIEYLEKPDLDNIFPAYDLFPMEQWYQASGMRFAMMVTTRGCHHGCAFCSQRKTPLRVRSVDSVLAEINRMIEKFDIDTLLFEDDMLLHNHQHAYDLFGRIAKLPKKLSIHCLSGISPAVYDKRLANIMRDAGLSTVVFGFETRQPFTKRKIKKIFASKEKIHKAVLWSKKAGIPDVRVFIIAGLPGITLQKCLDDIEYIFKKGAIVNLNCYYPIFGTPLCDTMFKKGYIISQDPNHFRSSYCPVQLPGFSRWQILKLLDYYHGLKMLLEFANLDECLASFGMDCIKRDSCGEKYIFKGCWTDWQLNPTKYQISNEKYCTHFANRLALWFSLCSEDFYEGRELQCGIAAGDSQCVFLVKKAEHPDDDTKYIISRLRICYHYYRKVNKK